MKLTRLTAATAGTLAAAGMLLAPAVAHADGTKDPKYQGPPTKSAPESPTEDEGAAPINNKRAPVKECGQKSESGEFEGEPSHHPYKLEPGTSSITVDYDTYKQPDKINVYAKGKLVGTTGWRGSEGSNTNKRPLQGDGTDRLTVALPARTTMVDVVVITELEGTLWNFTVGCVKA